MHGLGNDFVVIDNFNGRINLSKEQVAYLCDRHKGIGADGVILVEKKEGADCFMNYINADGTFASMCGNGVRCTAKFLKDLYLKDKNEFIVATRDGIKNIQLFDDDTFSVNMGQASFEHADFPKDISTLEGLELNFVSMGNPFAITFMDDIDSLNVIDFYKIGHNIEYHPKFPNRMNLELVEEINSKEFKVKVWERGCGETLACGTGACAVFALLRGKGNQEKEITIQFPGGKLFLSENENGDIMMRGPAVNVYGGLVEVK